MYMSKITSIIIIHLLAFTSGLYAQYTKPDGTIDEDIIIQELKKYEDNYLAQDSLADFFFQWILFDGMKMDTSSEGKVKMRRAEKILSNLGNRSGKFEFLSLDYRNWRDVPRNEVGRDTVDSRINLLEEKWDRYLDSIQFVFKELFSIANDIRVTQEGRDKTAGLLGRTNDPEMMEYLIKNDRHYRFGGYIDDPYSWEECWGCNRGALRGLIYDKVSRYQVSGYGEENMKNWLLFPLMIRYWGDQDYDNYVQYIPYSGDKLEALAFIRLVEGYKKPWLIYEFMEANAENPKTEILKGLGEIYLDEKRYYESLQSTPSKK